MRKTKLIASIFFLSAFITAVGFAETKADALELYRAGKYGESIDICLAEIQESPQNLESHVVLCWSLVQAKRYDEADSWAEKGRAISKYDPRIIEIQAEAKYYRGQNEQSLKLFQEYISYAPNGSRIAPVYYYMGELYLRMAKYRHADMAFSAALQLENLNAEWWVRLGYAREMAKDYRYALVAYNKALELNANLQDAIRGKERVSGQF
jgi:tetratricopeptide (TPR) repeat protein